MAAQTKIHQPTQNMTDNLFRIFGSLGICCTSKRTTSTIFNFIRWKSIL